MKYIAKLILLISGWKTVNTLPPELKRYVMLSVPHTSNWDFFYGRISLFVLGIKVNTLIKKEFFFFPVGYILKALGAIPIDRSKGVNVMNETIKMFENNENLIVLITPEGTRKLQKNWKRGFYYMAVKANVPLVLGYIDYLKKETGLTEVFHPTGNYEKDMVYIENFYKDKTARYPENFNLSNVYLK
ncbi:MAG: 1-acyl-sn-glycerol-3-phosphate acyltransferase [Bacteroidales bacterium]|nr:1-acyl-sn-glycerol-3-phosphate acyltransferase [Bacteroidales bacterium]